MISVRVAAVATQFIGLLWVLLAALYSNDPDGPMAAMLVGFAVAAAGFVVWLIAGWWEGRQ